MNEHFFEELRQLIQSSNSTGKPIYLALAEQMERYILSGVWPDALRLPPDAFFAEKLGISHITLGKALNQLRKKELLQRSRSLGTFVYTPKENIRGTTVQNQRKLVALLLDDIQSGTLNSPFLQRILSGLEAENLGVLLQSAAGKPQQQYRQLLDAMVNPECHGALVWSIFDNDTSRRILARKPARWPVIFMNESPQVIPREFDAVVYDGYTAGLQIGEKFFADGGRRIFFLTADWRLHYDSIRQRLQGLHQAAQKYQIPEENIVIINYKEQNIPLELLTMKQDKSLLIFGSPQDLQYTQQQFKQPLIASKISMPCIGFASNLDLPTTSDIPLYLFDSAAMIHHSIDLLSLRLQGSQISYKDIKITGKIS